MSLFRCKGQTKPFFEKKSLGRTILSDSLKENQSHGFSVYCNRTGTPIQSLHNIPYAKKRHSGTPPDLRRFEKRERASYCIEASVILPLFACICVFVLLFFRILTVEWGIETAIREVAENMALYGESQHFSASSDQEGDGVSIGEVLSTTGIAAATTARIISLGVPIEYVDHNILGLDYSGCEISDNDITISVRYRITIPVLLLGRHTYDITQSASYRRWVGFSPQKYEDDKDQYVYVARYGEDYHNKRDCPYLAPSVRAVTLSELPACRNKSGGKYHACSLCTGSMAPTLSTVYITNYGTTFHCNNNCSGLKRTVYTIELDEARSKYSPCPKCGN